MRYSLVSFLILFIGGRAYCSDASGSLDSQSPKGRVTALDFLSLPFYDFLCRPTNLKRSKAYAKAMINRPEFAAIDWNTPSATNLAEQIWGLHREENDYAYHKALNVAIKTMLQVHHVHPDQCESVFRILMEWKKVKKARLFHQGEHEALLTSEKAAQRRLKRNALNRVRTMYQKKGMNLPLLYYMKLTNPKALSLTDLHEMALKYQYMYSSSHSFLKHLRNMWNALGYKSEEVILQNMDPRNRSYPGWSSQASGEGSTMLAGPLDESTRQHPDQYYTDSIIDSGGAQDPSTDLSDLENLGSFRWSSMLDEGSFFHFDDAAVSGGYGEDIAEPAANCGEGSTSSNRVTDPMFDFSDDDPFLPTISETQHLLENDDVQFPE